MCRRVFAAIDKFTYITTTSAAFDMSTAEKTGFQRRTKHPLMECSSFLLLNFTLSGGLAICRRLGTVMYIKLPVGGACTRNLHWLGCVSKLLQHFKQALYKPLRFQKLV